MTVIKVKNSNVAGRIPAAGDLQPAELAINLQDKKLYSKDVAGTVFEIGVAGDVPTGNTPPSTGNNSGDLFFDTSSNELKYWSGSAWEAITVEPADGNGYVQVGGDTMTGQLTLPGGGTGKQAATVGEVNAAVSGANYLSTAAGAGDQTVASTGTTTFDGLVEAGTGVKVTGGRLSVGPDAADVQTHVLISGATGTGGGNQAAIRIEEQFNRPDTGGINAGNSAIVAIPQQTAVNAEWNTHFRAGGVVPEVGITVDNVAGFFADSTLAAGGNTSYGFYSNIGNSGKFNFYAAGSAPNYFNGQLLLPHASSSIIIAGNPIDGSSNDPFANVSGTEIKYGKVRVSSGSNISLDLKRETDGYLAMFYQGAVNVNTQKGSISVDAAGVSFNETSDYRLKSNVVDLPAASEVVKTLQPRSYSIGGLDNVSGFIAHELQAVVPRAVVGTKDATEAIGTLYDFDGTVLETEVTEPSADELTYTEDVTDSEGVTTQAIRTRTWTSTGTRPVYQGVDQTKLIPLLTKALQEALERIEALEAQLGSGGASVAAATTKKK